MTPEGWSRSTLGQNLREPIRNGYSPNCPTLPTGKWIAHLGAVTENGFNRLAVKPAPPHDPRVDASRLVVGDLLVSRSNTRERVGLAGIYRGAPAPCSYPDLLMRVRPSGEVDSEFLLHALLSRRGRDYFHKVARGTSGSMVKIDRALLESFPLLLPPLVEQRRIAEALSAVDEVIGKAAVVVQQLVIARRSLLRRLLASGMPSRRHRCRQTEVGPAPESWTETTLGELASDVTYGTSVKCDGDSSALPVLRIPNVVSGQLTTDLKYARLRDADVEQLRLSDGDLLFVRTNGNPDYVGRSIVFPRMPGTWLFASYLIRVRVSRAKVDPRFVHIALQEPGVRRTMEKAIRTSAGNYNLNSVGIRATRLNLPSLPEQMEIADGIEALDARLRREIKYSLGLRSLKSSLAEAVLSGQLRVDPHANHGPEQKL